MKLISKSYQETRAEAFAREERGEFIDGEIACRAEFTKLGKRTPTPGYDAPRSDLIEARAEYRNLVNAISSRMLRERRNLTAVESAAWEHAGEVVNSIEKTLSMREGIPVKGVAAEGSDLGSQVWLGLEENREILSKTGSVRFTVKAAAGDPLTTSDARTIVSGGVGYPGGAVIGVQYALSTRTAEGVSAMEYSRFAAQEGAAAVQATEGSAKAAVRPTFTTVTQPAITIAGHTKLSKQAASDSAELRRAVNATLYRSNDTTLDDVLTGGSVAPVFAGLEALATAYTSLVYDAIPDAVSEGVATMVQAGFRPDVVVLNPADWLKVQVAQSAVEKLYLSGSYLGPLPEAMRGLRVVVSPGLTAGKALLMDSAQVELIVVDGFQIYVGYDGNDFTKNLVTILGERRIIPTYRAVGAARLITPMA